MLNLSTFYVNAMRNQSPLWYLSMVQQHFIFSLSIISICFLPVKITTTILHNHFCSMLSFSKFFKSIFGSTFFIDYYYYRLQVKKLNALPKSRFLLTANLCMGDIFTIKCKCRISKRKLFLKMHN